MLGNDYSVPKHVCEPDQTTRYSKPNSTLVRIACAPTLELPICRSSIAQLAGI